MSEKVYTQADYDALMEPMRCGHHAANLTRLDEGPDVCIVCQELAAKDAELALLRGVVAKAADALNDLRADACGLVHDGTECCLREAGIEVAVDDVLDILAALPAPADLVCPACGPVKGKHPDVCSFTPQPVVKPEWCGHGTHRASECWEPVLEKPCWVHGCDHCGRCYKCRVYNCPPPRPEAVKLCRNTGEPCNAECCACPCPGCKTAAPSDAKAGERYHGPRDSTHYMVRRSEPCSRVLAPRRDSIRRLFRVCRVLAGHPGGVDNSALLVLARRQARDEGGEREIV